MADFLPPVADAGVDRIVFMNSRVELSAGGSTGTIASYSWTQTGGPAVNFSNGTTPEIHFIYPELVLVPPAVPPTLTFKVTVIGPGGTSSDEININTTATPPTVAAISFAQVKRATEKDGSITENWTVEGAAIPVVAGSTVTNLIVTNTLGATADLIVGTGCAPLTIGVTGDFGFDSKDSAPAASLGTDLSIHAVMSDGTVGPSVPVVVEVK
ncbi:MAG: hypothetical protein ACE5FZ_08315 [Nitrospiria bacterium]